MKVYQNSARIGTVFNTWKQSEKNNTAPAFDVKNYDHISDPKQVDILNEAMEKLKHKAFEMVTNHARIMSNEGNILKKVKEYEQNVNRVSKQLREDYSNVTNH